MAALAKRMLPRSTRRQRLSGDHGRARPAGGTDPQFTLRLVSAFGVKEWWPLVSEGLRVVRLRVKPSWEIEDVYVSLKKGHASLYVSHHGDQYAGFCVCVPTPDPFQPVTDLFVWATYARVPGALEACLAQLAREAAQAGFASLVFHSPRKGWLRKLPGFQIRETVYEMRL